MLHSGLSGNCASCQVVRESSPITGLDRPRGFQKVKVPRFRDTRVAKIILYKTLIRPVVLCGAEAWTLTKKEEQAVLIFERKIFRRIYGPKYENGKWKSRTNRELEEISKGENIVK